MTQNCHQLVWHPHSQSLATTTRFAAGRPGLRDRDRCGWMHVRAEEQRELMRELTTDDPTARTECGTPETKGPLLVTIKLRCGRDSLLSGAAVQENPMLCNSMFRVRQVGGLANHGCNLGLGEFIRSAVLVSPQLMLHATVRCTSPYRCHVKMSKERRNATFRRAGYSWGSRLCLDAVQQALSFPLPVGESGLTRWQRADTKRPL